MKDLGVFVFILGILVRSTVLTLGIHIPVYQLDDRHRRGIGGAETGADDTGITAIAFAVAIGKNLEKLLLLGFVHQTRMRETTVGQATAFAERDQLFDNRTQFLGLGNGGHDLFVLDQCRREILQESLTVSTGPLHPAALHSMTHSFSFVR